MAQFLFRDTSGKQMTPAEWLSHWASQFPAEKYSEEEYESLVHEERRRTPDFFERVGRWKDRATSQARWKPNVASVAFVVWQQAAVEQPACPTDDEVHDFLVRWSSRAYVDRFATRSVTKTFGLSRATTLLHFLSRGRFPIFDSRVRRAAERLTGQNLKTDVPSYLNGYLPLFSEIQRLCGAEGGRRVDQALFACGDKAPRLER